MVGSVVRAVLLHPSHGYQDTWTSNNDNGLYYFEGGRLRGRTDYLCGKGDAFFNEVNLVMCEKGGYLAVPSKSIKYGYVFKNCTIDGEKSDINGNYTLGRPWGEGTPKAYYINTTMNVQPSAIGWSDMGTDGYPAQFAEYNSMTSTGTVIDLAGRKTSFGANNHPNVPALQIGLIQNTLSPKLNHQCHALFAADHGIEREGVSVSPREVTWQQLLNFCRGGGGVNMFCHQHDFFLRLIDVGVHTKGLVHISELADRFVKDPTEVVTLHQQVQVRVLSVDLKRERMSLSMKGLS